jgi:hypothetical protein
VWIEQTYAGADVDGVDALFVIVGDEPALSHVWMGVPVKRCKIRGTNVDQETEERVIRKSGTRVVRP